MVRKEWKTGLLWYLELWLISVDMFCVYFSRNGIGHFEGYVRELARFLRTACLCFQDHGAYHRVIAVAERHWMVPASNHRGTLPEARMSRNYMQELGLSSHAHRLASVHLKVPLAPIFPTRTDFRPSTARLCGFLSSGHSSEESLEHVFTSFVE